MEELKPEINDLFEFRSKVFFQYSVGVSEERKVFFERLMEEHGFKFLEKGTFKQEFVIVNIDAINRSEK